MVAELGETKDPKELIPGDAGALEDVARTLRKRSDTFEDVGKRMGAVRIDGWTGKASDEFWEGFSGEKRNWQYASDQMSGAASAISGYAGALSGAQQQAREAISLWDDGDKSQAQETLKTARQQVRDEGEIAATKLADAAGGDSKAPDWLTRAGEVAEQKGENGKSKWTIGERESKNPLVSDSNKKRFGTPSTQTDSKHPWEVKIGERKWDGEVWKGETEGETQFGDGGKLAGKADLKLLGAEGSVGASVTDGKLQAQASGSAYLAKTSAEGSVEYGIVGAKAQGEAFAGAEASAKASVGKDGVHAGIEAFAGAKATGSVSADVGGIGAGVTGEAWAGAGAEANVDIGMQGGKFKIGGELGVGLGIGGKIGADIEIDVDKVADTVGEVGDAVGDGIDAIGDGLNAINPFG
jgi:hypothetical protein